MESTLSPCHYLLEPGIDGSVGEGIAHVQLLREEPRIRDNHGQS